MPRYEFRCVECGLTCTENQPVEQRLDIIWCERGFQMRRVFGSGLQLSVSEGRQARAEKEKDIERNVQSYKALTAQGYHPPSAVDGAHRIEATAQTRAEINYGHNFLTDIGRKAAQEWRKEDD